MSDKPAVENTPSAAPENLEPVNQAPAGESNSDNLDYQKEYETLLEEQLKTAEERDNYKKGLLKAKGKLPDDEIIEEDDDRVRRIVIEQMAESKSAQIEKAKEDLIKKTLLDNAELRKALANKSQISDTPPGSSVDNPPVKADGLLTKEQTAYFKSKGWSDAKIKAYAQNYAKRLNKA